ncbi:hypothetical protein [Microbacterium sp. gxy059]|uniref:hypothetical protein n=1 Tax=Microbacterium sp. gxy059 TaxID=2957199 RepID=UPI003D9A00DB
MSDDEATTTGVGSRLRAIEERPLAERADAYQELLEDLTTRLDEVPGDDAS